MRTEDSLGVWLLGERVESSRVESWIKSPRRIPQAGNAEAPRAVPLGASLGASSDSFGSREAVERRTLRPSPAENQAEGQAKSKAEPGRGSHDDHAATFRDPIRLTRVWVRPSSTIEPGIANPPTDTLQH